MADRQIDERKRAQARAKNVQAILKQTADELFNLGATFDDPDIAMASGLLVQVRQHVDRYVEHFTSGREFEQ